MAGFFCCHPPQDRRVRRRLAFLPDVTVTHLGGGSSSLAPTRFLIEMLRANRVYWRKHEGKMRLLAYDGITLVHLWLRLIPS